MKLSILIPARNEEFIGRTIQNILDNIEGETEVIAVLDGYTVPIPEIPKDPRVTVINLPKSIGQRAATNLACKLSEAKYVAKTDAHCSFDKGFDVKLMADMQDDWTIVPTMMNLHAFDWVCNKCGNRWYQGPTPTHCIKSLSKDEKIPNPDCDSKDFRREMIWQPNPSPKSTAYRFDNTLHFQYWGEYKKKQIGDLVESMSLQGSFFMMTRDKYWELDICDEKHGSWGQQGTEVACKTWLSGGKVIVSKKTWYAHMFRTQGGDFSFPYPNNSISQARKYSRELWIENKWDKAKYPLQWLLDKFNPPGWGVSVGILYYTDNEIDEKMMKLCQEWIRRGAKQNRIVSVSLKKIEFGDNITLPLERSKLTMHKQILYGLKELDTDIVYFCEHDIIYHPSHFEFIPPKEKKEIFFYNKNLWRVRRSDGFAVKYDHKSLSQMCAWRETLLKEYEERVRRIEKEGFNNGGFEPGTRGLWRGGFSNSKSEFFESQEPNIDIRHNKNLSASKWKPEEFRNQKSCLNWQNSNIENLWAKDIFKQL